MNVVRVACNNNFNCTAPEWRQLREFTEKYPDDYFFVNSNVNTPALLSINDHPYKAVITINPDLIPSPRSLDRFFRLDQTKIAFVRIKWMPGYPDIRRLFTVLLIKGYTVMLTLQRFNSEATLTKYTQLIYYKFDCSRFRLVGQALDDVQDMVDTYHAASMPAYICDRTGEGCMGCGQCATLTVGIPATIKSLNLSKSGICPFSCPDCYAKTMQNFLQKLHQPLIHYDRIYKNRKQAGQTVHSQIAHAAQVAQRAPTKAQITARRTKVAEKVRFTRARKARHS